MCIPLLFVIRLFYHSLERSMFMHNQSSRLLRHPSSGEPAHLLTLLPEVMSEMERQLACKKPSRTLVIIDSASHQALFFWLVDHLLHTTRSRLLCLLSASSKT